MSDSQRERELKFDVPDGFVVPDLQPLVAGRGGRIEHEVLNLESTYHDTEDRDLLGFGITLRRRTGDADTGWQLKVPDGNARTEVRVPLGGRGVPAEIRALTVGARGRGALKPIATLRTERTVARLLDADGAGLAEVVDDQVVAHTTREFAITRSWREVEVELLGGDEKLLRRTASLLGRHGASTAAIGSKLAHAIDAPAHPQRDPDLLSGIVGAYLDEQFAVLVHGDVELRRGGDVIHPTRVASRRYRSALRVFGKVLDPDRAAHLDAELKWFAGVLGEVRDLQVLRRHLAGALDGLSAELVVGPVRARIDTAIDVEEATALDNLRLAMTGRRYLGLLAELRRWRDELPMTGGEPSSDVRRYLRRAERVLHRRLDLAHGADHTDEAYHRARKAAKRARYTAELSRPVLGKQAAKAAKRAKDLQTRFGDRQDNVVAAQFLQRLGAVPGRNGFTFGVLYQRERMRGEAID